MLLVPVGGGGLCSGTLISASALSPSTAVYGAEPSTADDAARSVAAGRIIPQTGTKTIADGLRTSLGPLTFEIIRKRIAGILTAGEDEIISATRLVWERMKIIIEPSSAVPLAALLCGRFSVEGKKAGIIVSGGNADLDRPPWTGPRAADGGPCRMQ